ncbi:MAG TPA: glycosyltransferase family 39 protein [Verrucomicrobiae bacterium]|nr:glycosyltransferase family 39 protein [Verrucomicrobiae bacterium]
MDRTSWQEQFDGERLIPKAIRAEVPESFPRARPGTGSGFAWVAAVVTVFLFLQLPGLTRLPAFGGDEVQYAEAAVNLLTTGRLAIPIWGSSRGFNEAFYINVPGYPLVLSGVYKVWGLGFWQTRLPALVCALFCLVLVMRMARLAGCEWWTAAAGASVLAVAPSFIQATRTGRPDTAAIFLALACLWVVLSSRHASEPRARAKPVLAGVLIGMGVMMHPNVLPVALGCVILLWLDEPRGPRVERTALFISGAILPVVPWFLIGVSHWPAFREQFIPWASMNSVLGGNPLIALRDEILQRYCRGYKLGPAWIVLLTVSLLLGFRHLWKQNRVVRGCLIVWLVQFVCFAFARTKEEALLVYTEPCIAVVAAVLLQAICRQPKLQTHKLARWSVIAAVGLVLVNGLGLMVVRYWMMGTQWAARDYAVVEQKLSARIPPGARVLGQGTVWLAGRRHRWQLRVLTQGGWVADLLDRQWDEAAVSEFEWVVLHPDFRRPSLEPVWAAVAKHFDQVDEIDGVSGGVTQSPSLTRAPYHLLVFRRRDSAADKNYAFDGLGNPRRSEHEEATKLTTGIRPTNASP